MADGAHVGLYGHTSDGQAVQRIVLQDGLRLELLTFGACIARLELPDRTNVVLGLPDLASYETRNPSFGVTVGRFANRIRGGRFTLDGRDYHLPQNEGANTLHGGRGFGHRVWALEDAGRAAATLRYRSADGEEGFPGTLDTVVTVTVEGETLRLDYDAQTDAPTVLNLTNHSYFNLGGEGSGDVGEHTLHVASGRILALDAECIPTGEVIDVEGTPFDFRSPRRVGERMRVAHPQIVIGLGYDCCFLLQGDGLREAATVRDERSGRAMAVWTDQPAVQLYTGNRLTGALTGPSGRTYRAGDGLCLETQHYPDSPNQTAFPDTTLRPGQRFRSTTEYRFSAR